MSETALPTSWNSGEMLDGLDITDKSELVGKPFRINYLTFYTNKDGVEIVTVDAEDVTGHAFTFNDSSSTGVRSQLADYLVMKDIPFTPGEMIEVSLVIPRGLRESKYMKEIRGKERQVSTFYLTTSGVRATVPPQPKSKTK